MNTPKRQRFARPSSKWITDANDRLFAEVRLDDGTRLNVEVVSPDMSEDELDAWAAKYMPRVEAAWRALTDEIG